MNLRVTRTTTRFGSIVYRIQGREPAISRVGHEGPLQGVAGPLAALTFIALTQRKDEPRNG